MTQAISKTNETLSAEDVVNYLASHPDFFQCHPDSLLELQLENTREGSISLVERQLKGLRDQNKDLKDELQSVINNAYENQLLLQQTIQLSLSLIPCITISELKDVLFTELKRLFDINYQNLLLNDKLFSVDAINTTSHEELQTKLGDNFPKNQPVCGRLKEVERVFLFGEKSEVKSVAILPLGDTAEFGVLVLGSDDESHFDPEMGDLFLVLISDMLSRQLERFSSKEN